MLDTSTCAKIPSGSELWHTVSLIIYTYTDNICIETNKHRDNFSHLPLLPYN